MFGSDYMTISDEDGQEYELEVLTSVEIDGFTYFNAQEYRVLGILLRQVRSMTVTLLPLGVMAVMGIDGDSLLQYLGHIIAFWVHRRRLHFRRIGYKYDPKQLKKPGRKGKKKKA